MIAPGHAEVVGDFAAFGVHAFTTTRAFGTVGTAGTEPVHEVVGRWDALRAAAAVHGVRRLATASQVHGARVIEHSPGWDGWLRGTGADGHVSLTRGIALGVTIADCVPVFMAHPGGAVAMLHSGWRGTAARIIDVGITALERGGCRASDLLVHLGPAICGDCYEVSADVAAQVTGEAASGPRRVDLRAIIAGHAWNRGVRAVTISPHCTRCGGDRFFSHRGGDTGRQAALIVSS